MHTSHTKSFRRHLKHELDNLDQHPTVFLALRPVDPLDDLVGNGIEPYHNDLTLRIDHRPSQVSQHDPGKLSSPISLPYRTSEWHASDASDGNATVARSEMILGVELAAILCGKVAHGPSG